jgi:anti-sigma factor RsiW
MTGLNLVLTMERLLAWEQWQAHFRRALAAAASTATPEQALRAVITHRRRCYREKPAVLASVLAFRHLVLRPELAEEDFAAWRADRKEKAARPEPGRAAVLRSTGRVGPADKRGTGEPAKPIGAVLGSARIQELLREMKEQVQ